MKKKFLDYYMDVAERTSKLSYAIRRQVGAVIVKDNRILSYGYNGMPSGWSNECEYKEFMPGDILDDTLYPFEEYDPTVESNRRYRLVTKDEVLHAEMNCISKVSGSTESSEDATMFCTTAPCIHCAKAIFQAGIKNVYYRDTYRDSNGIKFLEKSGVNVHKYTNESQNNN
jgi:dCMP deaminase